MVAFKTRWQVLKCEWNTYHRNYCLSGFANDEVSVRQVGENLKEKKQTKKQSTIFMITGELGEEKQRGQPMFFPNLEILSWNYLNSKIISQIRGPRLKHQIIRIKNKA